MKNKVILLLFVISFIQVSFGQEQYKGRMFPYYINFEEGEGQSRITESIGSGAPKGDDRYTEEGILLTDDTKNTMSGFYLNDLLLKKNYMFELEFQYAAYEGTPYGGEYGEGLTMFFFDASKSFSLGSQGSGLGYAYNNASSKQAGLNGAYFAMGIDTKGDFRLKTNTTTNKREGIDKISFQYDDSFITFRGGQHKNDRYKGYPVLYSRTTYGWSNSNNGEIEAKLDIDTGDYETGLQGSISNVRTDYGAYLRFNSVYLRINPKYYEDEDWTVSASIKGMSNFYQNIGPSIRLYDKMKTRDENGNIYTLESAIPEELRVGFVATTGQATQKHLIKDVKITLEHAPKTYDKEVVLCLSEDDDTEILTSLKDPFKGSSFYVGGLNSYKSGDTFREIDLDSARLEDEEGLPLNYRREDYGYETYSLIYEEPGVGEWDLYRGQSNLTLLFTPANKKMPEGEYSVYISAKSVDTGEGGPYSDEAYRSRPTKITVKAKYCKSVVNPRLPIKVRVED